MLPCRTRTARSQLTPTIVPLRSSTLRIYLGHYHASHTLATLIICFTLQAHLLTLLLVGQDLFFVLLETDEVKVQVFDTVFLEQVLSNQTRQIDACLGQGDPVLIQ